MIPALRRQKQPALSLLETRGRRISEFKVSLVLAFQDI